MNVYVLMFGAHFAYVFLKAFQQRNVAFDHYQWVMPVSYGMSAMEVYIIATVAVRGFTIGSVVALGTAGGLGAIAAMWLHKRVLR